ncbi:MAG: ECF transporter S component [Clostridia bacterium]|nr:ECF transporter S component [Clostridia bacterium]
MQNTNWRLRRLCVMAVLCAMAFAAVSLVRIPVVSFLKYEPKDVLLVIGAFLFGPLAGGIMSALVALVEMITISDTGIIGCAMNLLSSCLFVCTAAAIYQHRRNLIGAVVGLVCGSLAATAGMLLWNYLITPLYMELPRQAVAEMLLPVFLPFNLLKTALNSTLTMLLYKPIVAALRASRLLPPTETSGKKHARAAWVISLFVLATLVLVLLAMNGII